MYTAARTEVRNLRRSLAPLAVHRREETAKMDINMLLWPNTLAASTPRSSRRRSRRPRRARPPGARQRGAVCGRNLASGPASSGVMHVRQLERTDGANTSRENAVSCDDSRRGNVSLQADPLVSSSWNAYAYADHCPVMKTDRRGLEDEDSCPAGSPICQSDETIVIEGEAPWGFWDLFGPGIWGFAPPVDNSPPVWGVPNPPAHDCGPPPDGEDCHQYEGEECVACCLRNWDEDTAWCRCVHKNKVQRAICVKYATEQMGFCIAACRKTKVDPLSPAQGIDGIGNEFDGGGFGGGGAGGNYLRYRSGRNSIGSSPYIHQR